MESTITLTRQVLSLKMVCELLKLRAEARFLIKVNNKVKISIDIFYILTITKAQPIRQGRPFPVQAMMVKYEKGGAELTAFKLYHYSKLVNMVASNSMARVDPLVPKLSGKYPLIITALARKTPHYETRIFDVLASRESSYTDFPGD